MMPLPIAIVLRFRDHADRQFLERRKVSVALFVAIFTLSFLYSPQPIVWGMLIQTLAGVATARLAAAFVQDAWIKRAIAILVLVMVGFQTLIALGVPLALMRLFILVWTVAGAAYYGWRARKGAVSGRPAGQVWLLRVIMTVATESDKVLNDPQPMVLFLNFGDSSLDFQLRVWIADFNERRIIQSALIQEIDRRFRSEGVEIPFPQRDLHLRSVDETAARGLTGDSTDMTEKGSA